MPHAHHASGAGDRLRAGDPAHTSELEIGDVALVRRDGALCGFALFHSAPLAAGRPQDELRILKLVAENVEASRR